MSAAWMVEALVASALLMAAVLLLRGPVRRCFGPQIAYALWALPALRLVLPPIPAAWREAAATPMAGVGETIVILVEPAAGGTAAAAAAAPLPWGATLLAAWGLGAIGFLGWHVVQHRRFCRRMLAGADRIEERDGIAVIASDAAPGPLAFGIRDRFVAFPRDFAERYDADERALALEHELGHHRRGDLVANWAALVVLALHWCNPVAWRAFRAFRADQELANDARVLAGRSRADAHVYACAILKAAHGGAVSAACHLHTIHDLKGRLRMLTKPRFSRRRLIGGAATVSLLGTIGLGLTVSGSEAAAAITDTVSERIAVAQATPPVPVPATPATPPAPVAAPVPPRAIAAKAIAPGRRGTHRVTIVKDGEATVYEGAEAEAYVATHGLDPAPPTPPLPPFTVRLARPPLPPRAPFAGLAGKPVIVRVPGIDSRVCKDGEGEAGRPSFTTEKDGRRVTIFCTNRFEAMRARGAELALNTRRLERDSIWSARLGLQSARASIAAATDLSDATRREALEGIDKAMDELEGRSKAD